MEHVGPAKIRLRARSAVPLLHLRHVAAKDSKLITDDYGFVAGAKMPLDEHDELSCP